MKRFVSLALATATLLGASILLPTDKASAKPICQVAADWADANLDNLPTKYDAFARLDVPFRKAAMGRLPAETRANLWSAHFDRVIENVPELTSEQRDFIEGVRSKLLDYMTTEPSPEEIDAISAAARDLFGFELSKVTFVTFGDPNWAAEAISISMEGAMEDCDCDGDEGNWVNWCGINFTCDRSSGCEPSLFGCSFLGLEACLGKCEATGPLVNE